jgi:DnaJ homolog subfamily C member 7
MVEATDTQMIDLQEEFKDPAELAECKKNEGNAALKAGNVDDAIKLYSEAIELNKNEGMFTNRAMAYIKQRKYKDALFDCEQALYLNPSFAKAHLRAYACHLAQGRLPKAKDSIEKAIALGETSSADKVPFIGELVKQEGFVKAAMARKEYREAVFYSGRLLEHCNDSIRHIKMKIKAAIMHTPTDMSDIIKFTYDV